VVEMHGGYRLALGERIVQLRLYRQEHERTIGRHPLAVFGTAGVSAALVALYPSRLIYQPCGSQLHAAPTTATTSRRMLTRTSFS
jgi:hypothetical protein